MIRRATGADTAALVRMSVALFPDGTAAEHERDIRARFAVNEAAYFVAEGADGAVCGFVEVGTRPYADGCDSSPVGYVEAWWVDPAARRTGIGRALLDAAEGWVRTRGLTEIASDTQLGNEVSRLGHLSAGFEEVDRVVQFRKRLGPAESKAVFDERI
jgi:aminoglycoside 6'-N-acetyltransferase I